MASTGEGRSTWSPLAHPLFRLLWIASTARHAAYPTHPPVATR